MKKFLFKNIFAVNIKDLDVLSLDTLKEMDYLENLPKTQRENIGLTPFLDDSNLFEKVGNCLFFKVKKEKKDVPTSVVNEILEKKKKEYFKLNQTKLPKKEQAALKEDIIVSLLPKAFIKSTYIEFYIDTKNNYLIVNGSSSKKMEEIVTLLKNLGIDFNISLIEPNFDLTEEMTSWVKNNEAKEPFNIGTNCSLFDPITAGEIVYKNLEIAENNEQLLQNLEHNNLVKELELDWHERITFKLNNEFILKSISITDSFEETVDEDVGEAEDIYNYFQGTMNIFVEDISEIISDILKK
tara:strand:- start:79782 stop:80672 length:891 start_codon:yes stop_codon:yes gene_type:complete